MSFIRKNWRILCGLYILIYLPWFYYLEKTITMDTPDIHILNTLLDNAIPYCKYFIIPYIAWFAYIAFACIIMLFKATDTEYIRFVLSLIIGMSICLLICTIYPNGLTIRPTELPDDIFGKLTMMIYASDTTTNVFPSIHVYNSVTIHIALSKSQFFAHHKSYKYVSLITCISICASTLFVRQHSIIDVTGALILVLLMYLLIYVVDYNKLLKKAPKEIELPS